MTLDEARLMANVNARSQRLFEDGYRARWTADRRTVEVRNCQGSTYYLDTSAGTCDCLFFQKHGGRHPCKHLLGWRRLILRQRSCRRLLALALIAAWADLDDADPRGRETEERKPIRELGSLSETEAACDHPR